MRQQKRPAAEMSRWVYLAVTVGLMLVVSMAALIFKSISRFPLARNHLILPLTEKQAATLLAEKAEAADARKKAAMHMLDATNFSAWL